MRGTERKADNRRSGSMVETFLLAKFRNNVKVYFTS